VSRTGCKLRGATLVAMVMSCILGAAWALALGFQLSLFVRIGGPNSNQLYRFKVLGLGHGCLFSSLSPPVMRESDPQWYVYAGRAEWIIWRPQKGTLPLWIPFLGASIVSVILWCLDRRSFLPYRCRKCGYNLTGNASGFCPECGFQIPPEKEGTIRGSSERGRR